MIKFKVILLVLCTMFLVGCFQNNSTSDTMLSGFKISKVGWVISNRDENFNGFGGCFYKFWIAYEGNIKMNDIEYAKIRTLDNGNYYWDIKIDASNFNEQSKYIGGNNHIYYDTNNKYALPIGKIVAEVKLKNGKIYTFEKDIPQPGGATSGGYKYVYAEDIVMQWNSDYVKTLTRAYGITAEKNDSTKMLTVKFKINDTKFSNGYINVYNENAEYIGTTKLLYYDYVSKKRNWSSEIVNNGVENKVDIRNEEIEFYGNNTFTDIAKVVIVLRDGNQYGGTGYDCESLSGKIAVDNYTNIFCKFDSEIADAVIHPTKPYIFVSDKVNKKITVLNYESGIVEKEIKFDYMVESLDICEEGGQTKLYAALLTQEHSYYWWEEYQNGYVSVIDADKFEKIETFKIKIDPYDLIIGRDGYIYIPSGSGQWTSFHSYNKVTHEKSGNGHIRQQSEVRLHPIENKIYAMDTDSSPRDIEVFFIDKGVFGNNYDSPYHGDYYFGLPFKIAPTGDFLISASGVILRCSNDEQDMTYINQLGEGFVDICFDSSTSKIFTITYNKTLNVYDYKTFTLETKKNMNGVGKYLFKKSNNLISISKFGNSVYGLEIITVDK